MASKKSVIGWIIAILVILGAGYGYFHFYYVFSDGTKTGELNTFSYTGYVFKTYEGEMILAGYGSKGSAGGSVQSKNFKFSVADKEVAEQISEMTGQRITVHYKQYFGTLPWRGYEKSIVDKIISAQPVEDSGYRSDEQIFL